MSDFVVNNKRITRNTVFLYVRLLIAMAVGLYTSRVVLAVLGNDDFGLNSVVGSIVAMFYFLNSSMAGTTSRFLAFELGQGNYEKLQKTFSSALIIHFLIALIVVLIGETIGLWYLENKLVVSEDRVTAAHWVYQLSLLSAVITIMQVPYTAVIIARERLNVYAYIEIIKTLLLLGIVFLLMTSNFDKLIFYAVLTLCVSLVIILIYRGYCVIHFSECLFKFHLDREIIKPMIGFTGWNLYTDLAYLAQNNGVNMILNLFFGTLINAAYGIGLQLSRVVYSFIASFTLAVKPQIIKYYSTNQIDEMENLMHAATRYSFLLLFTLAFPVIMETNFILFLWLKDFPYHSVTFCRLFLIMMLLNVLWLNLTYATQATNKMKKVSMVIGTLYILIPFITYVAFKLGCRIIYIPMFITIGIYLLVITARLFILKELIPQISILKFCNKVIFLSILVSVVGSLLPLFIHFSLEEGWIRLILVTLASVVTMTLATYYLTLSKPARENVLYIIVTKLKFSKPLLR